jgi:hypothetical protein
MNNNIKITLEVIGQRALDVQVTRGRLKRSPKCQVQLDIGKHVPPCWMDSLEEYWCEPCKIRNQCWKEAKSASKALSSGLTTYRYRIEKGIDE